jgi:methyl-accepting chemotaxis protein
MAQQREAVDEAVQLMSEATEEVEAAVTEKDRGGPGVSVGLLLDALEKERDSLDLMEQGVETLREAIEQRRRSLELQQQVLLELSESYQSEASEK